METNKILSAELIDLIFDDRNKAYGAYELRKFYKLRITRALMITFSIALLAIVGSVLANTLRKKNDTAVKMDSIILSDVNNKEKVIPPVIPPPKVQPVKVEMKAFTPPVIKQDDDVQKPPPANDDLKDVQIALVDQDGIKDVGIQTPQNIDDNKGVIDDKNQTDRDEPFMIVQVEAGLPDKWYQYLERNCNAQVATDNGAPEGKYPTIVQFVVDLDGNISNVIALTHNGYGMEEEAVRAIKKGPKWKPAINNGVPVKAYRKQNIVFEVTAAE